MPNIEQSNPVRPKRIHELEEVANLDLVGDEDLFVIDRVDDTGDWTNYKITAKNASDQIAASVIAQIPAQEDDPVEQNVGLFDGLNFDLFEDYDLGAITSLDGGRGWADAAGRVQNGEIVSRTTVGSLPQNRLSLLNGQFARQFSFGGKWNYLRLGILARINGAATLNSRLAFGVCNGTANVYNDATCNNFVGIVTGYDLGTDDDWTFSNQTQADVFISGRYENIWRRTGSADTSVGGSFNTNPPGFPSTESYLAFWYIEVQRPVFTGVSAVTYSKLMYATGTGSQTGFHTPRSEWYEMLTNRLAPSANAPTDAFKGGSAGPFTIASVTETTGIFDAMCIWWENATVPLEIAAIGVRKYN